MRPLSTGIARLDDWRLVFDLAIGRGERGVANVRPSRGDHVWGIVYELTRGGARRLDLTEGMPFGAYRREWVEVVLPSGQLQACYTLHAHEGRVGRKPSPRYMGLLLAGARHHGLPADWIETLRATPLAVDERDPQLEFFGRARE